MASDRNRSMARDRNDGRLDLRLGRVIDAPRALIWKAWTDPEHVKKWWTPAPWTTTECVMELRPGGMFRTVMRSPEGETILHDMCFLELIENERIVWTSALEPGYRPAVEKQSSCGGAWTAILTLAEQGGKTHYSVVVLHKDEAGRKLHEQLGFYDGWNTALDQLVAVTAQLKG
jgi:uncharacterized protein YndB with AHSA1/START domain